MIIALLISPNPSLASKLRDAVGGNAFIVHASSIEAAARPRAATPDLVIHDMGSTLADAPLDALRALAPGRPVMLLTNRDDPLSEAAWLRSGVRAVIRPDDIAAMGGQIERVAQLPVATNGSNGHGPQIAQRPAVEPAPSWEAALRCLVRAWPAGADANTLARLCVELCQESVRPSRIAVLLADGHGGLSLAAGDNLPEDVRTAYRAPHGATLLTMLESSPRLLRPADLYQAHERLAGLLGAVLCAPLLSDEGVEGVLAVAGPASGGSYGPEHEELLLLLARLLGRALADGRRHAQVSSQQLRYDDALNEAPAGLICLTPDLRIDAMNRVAEELLEIERGQAAGRHVQSVHSGLCDAAMRVQAGENLDQPVPIRRPRGGELEARLQARPDGSLVIAIVPRPESRVHREKDASASLWEAIALRMAQEIKNPLVAINTFAQLLPRKYESEEFRAAFGKVVQEEIERINGVVDTLYQFAAEPKLHLQRLDLNTTVREVVDTFARSVAERGIKVESRLKEEPLAAAIDPEAFRVVMEQLMRNAADAMPDGGLVSISAQAKGTDVEIRVEDTGVGVSREDAPRIFDPFYSSRERGAGLGLTIAKKLTEAQEGSLELESPAEGARFLLKFPGLAGAGRSFGSADHADHPGN